MVIPAPAAAPSVPTPAKPAAIVPTKAVTRPYRMQTTLALPFHLSQARSTVRTAARSRSAKARQQRSPRDRPRGLVRASIIPAVKAKA